ncbi:SPOSA6832_02818, partial [Sporobolomyces salmonicolor]
MVRFKHRYLLVHLVFPSSIPSHPISSLDSSAHSAPPPAPPPLSESVLIGLLRDSLSVNFGDVGAGEVGGTFSTYREQVPAGPESRPQILSPSTSTLILRVWREHYRTLVGGHEVVARVVHASGTIRKTQHAAIAHDRQQILLATAAGRRRRTRPRCAEAGAAQGREMEMEREREKEEQSDAEVEERLRASEKAIMALEA